MKSVMSHQFSNVPQIKAERSLFDRSHGYKTTFNAGDLVPFFVDEVLPGDTFRVKTSILCRMMTPVVPIMDNIFLDTFYFFVPTRLIWTNFLKFMGEKEPNDNTTYLTPIVQLGGGENVTIGTLGDYMGIPTGKNQLAYSALPFRAYLKIFNDWFRDQNLQNSLTIPMGDGPDAQSSYVMQKRGKRHDYFTSALPWPQKGPGVMLPLGTTAPVIGNGHTLDFYDGTNRIGLLTQVTTGAAIFATAASGHNAGDNITPQTYTNSNKGIGLTTDKTASGLIADLTNATAATINSLRQAFQWQRMYEKDARGGSRYTEIIRSHFGVVSPDARLQRAEFLGGSSNRINITPVQQTSATGSTGTTTPQGNLAAFAVATDSKGGFHKSFTEHGYIIGLINVRADLTYQQGLPKMYSRRTRFDFYWPTLAHLGEQEIYNQEIFTQGSGNAADTQVFGYQERFAEYRYFPSQITGDLRSSSSLSLDVWHCSEEFATLPALNSTFIRDNSQAVLARNIAVQDEPQFLFDSYMELHCARPMPVYSVPGLIDHF